MLVILPFAGNSVSALPGYPLKNWAQFALALFPGGWSLLFVASNIYEFLSGVSSSLSVSFCVRISEQLPQNQRAGREEHTGHQAKVMPSSTWAPERQVQPVTTASHVWPVFPSIFTKWNIQPSFDFPLIYPFFRCVI